MCVCIYVCVCVCVCVCMEEKQYLEKDSQTQALVNSTSSQTEPSLTSQDHKPSRNDRHGQETQVDLNTIKAKIVTASTSSAEEEISSENRNSSNSLNTPLIAPHHRKVKHGRGMIGFTPSFS